MSVIQKLSLVMDSAALSKLENDFRAAAQKSTAALKQEFDRAKGELRLALTSGMITKEEFAKRGREIGEAYNKAVTGRIEELRTAGKLTTEEFNKLSKSLVVAGQQGGQSASLLSKAWGGFKNLMTTLAPTVIAALTIRAVKDFVQESIKAAMDSEKSFARVAASVEAIGVKWSDVSDEVVAATAKIQQNSRFDDDTAARSFQILLDKTQDYGKSLKNLGFVADYAAAKNIGMEEAAEILGKAMAGNTTALEKANPLYKGHAKIIDELRDKYQGFAAKDLNTFDGALAHLKNMWGDLHEELGFVFLDAGEGSSIFETLTGAITTMTTWIKDNRAELSRWVTLGLKATIETFKILFTIMTTGWRVVGAVWDGVQRGWHGTVAAFESGVLVILGGLLKLEQGALTVAKALSFMLPKGTVDKIQSEMRRLEGTIADVSTSYAKHTVAMQTVGVKAPKAVAEAHSVAGARVVQTEAEIAAAAKAAALALEADHKRAAEAAKKAHEKAAKEAAEAYKRLTDEVADAWARSMAKIGDSNKYGIDKALNYSIEAQRKADARRLQDLKGSIVQQRTVEERAADARRQAEVDAGTVMVEASTKAAKQSSDAWIQSMQLMVTALGNLASMFKGTLGAILSGFSGVASGVGAIAAGLTQWKEAGKDSEGGLLATFQKIAGAAGALGGIVGGVMSAISLGSKILGGLGITHRDKDPGRMASNQSWYQAALGTDKSSAQEALRSLYKMSGRQKAAEGWATDAARDDAFELYLLALKNNPALAPIGSNTENLRNATTSSSATTVAGSVGLTVPSFAMGGLMPRTGLAQLHAGELVLPPDLTRALLAGGARSSSVDDHRAFNATVNVNLYGPADADGARRVAQEVSVQLGRMYQTQASLQGSTLLPS